MTKSSNISCSASRRGASLFASTGLARFACLALLGLASLPLASAAGAQALPNGGTVVGGGANIVTGANNVTVTQTTQAAAINWQGFSIGKGNSVVFVQPNSNAVALNRVTGSDPSVILGNLSANGKVFLVNGNGILFGKGANVNVGGLVASTLDLSTADFMAGHYKFTGSGGAVRNQGSINADGGYVALLGGTVSNDGLIQANLGTVALAAGEAITLDVAGDGLLNVAVDKGAVNALVENGGMVRANGGTVVMTAQAAGALLHTVVNNSGVIEARTLETHDGVIKLLGDMQSGTTNTSGRLDASAPDGGNGGFIETSAANVNIASSAIITTAAPAGVTGTWLIDPQDFTIGAAGNISGGTLSTLLVTNSVVITTSTGTDTSVAGAPPIDTLHTAAPGNGDIFVNDAVSWTASSNTTTLTMNAVRDVNVNAPISATNGNVVICCGRDANIDAAITTTNGSVLISSGRDVNVGVLTVTDGNLTLCAGLNVLISGAVTQTNSAALADQSLGLDPGMTIITGNNGTGPGVAAGTLIFAPLTAPVTVTNAPVSINYNPASYASPTDYSTRFVLTAGAALTQRMLLFPTATMAENGGTAVVLTKFKTNVVSGVPAGVTLVAGPGATAAFDSAGPGSKVGITYSGYSIGGPNAASYALAVSCCGLPTRTTGTITVVPVVVPPVVVPPVVVPPVVVPPIVVPPVVVPPVVTPPVVVPPVVTPPPVVVPPVVTPPVVLPPVVVPPDVPPVIPPVVVVIAPAPEVGGGIITSLPAPILIAPGGFTLAVLGGGVRMPTYQVATFQPAVAPSLSIAPVAIPQMPAKPAPVYVPKQDRN